MSVICSECQFQNQSDAELCRRCKFPFDGEWPSLISQTIGNYQLVRRVGGGGFGAVYHAKHVTLGNSFAVKILHPNLAKEEHFIERFQQEAYVLAELRHEHMLQVIDFGFLEEVGFYLITEWLEGRNLYRIWRRHPQLDRGWLLALFSQLLDALSYAHERGIVHRDLKPENLMLTKGARNRMLLKIVDFGIAKIVEQGANADGANEERRSTMAVGTPYYMAPEQVQGLIDRIGPRTDLYACGIILAEMLTGQRVFEGHEQRETMRLHLEAFPPTLGELHPEGNFSEKLQHVIYRALAKDVDERFPNAEAFYAALEEAMTETNVEPIWEDIYQSAEPAVKSAEDRPERPYIEYRRLEVEGGSSHLPGILLGLVFLLAMLGGGFFFLSQMNPPPPKKKQPTKRRKVIATGWKKFITPRKRKATPTVDINLPADAGALGTIPAPRPAQRRRSRPGTRRRRNVRRTPSRSNNRPKPATKQPPRTPPRTAPKPKAVVYTYRLVTNPPGGKVYVNKKLIGKTPITIKGEKGKLLRIRATMDDKVDFKYNWRVSGNKTRRHRFIEDL